MFEPKAAFGGFSVDSLEKARQFYSETLGLIVEETMGGMKIELPSDNEAWVYSKEDHQPATYTVLNFLVDDLDQAADALAKKGVQFERYEGMNQDDKGIARGKQQQMGPDIAWFKDPAGNIISVLEA